MSRTQSNIVSLQALREIREAETQEPEYRARILVMDKLELLEEMVRFQEERTKNGVLSTQMMIRGKILFKALEESAETQELKLLTRSYRRHLEFELLEYVKTGKLHPTDHETDPSVKAPNRNDADS